MTASERNRARDPIEVAAGLIFRAGKLLITQRRPGDHLGGLWEFPGGKRESSETCVECLARELREELGVEVSVGELIETVRHEYPEKTVVLHFYRCSLVRNEPQALACHSLEWIGPEDLARFEFPAADQQLLFKLREQPELWREG